MKALPNNNKPATHFIEVWRSKISYSYNDIQEIKLLRSALLSTEFLSGTTIAIFKIRLK